MAGHVGWQCSCLTKSAEAVFCPTAECFQPSVSAAAAYHKRVEKKIFHKVGPQHFMNKRREKKDVLFVCLLCNPKISKLIFDITLTQCKDLDRPT